MIEVNDLFINELHQVELSIEVGDGQIILQFKYPREYENFRRALKPFSKISSIVNDRIVFVNSASGGKVE